MHRLYAAANLQEAHLIVGMLASAGIDARIFNEHSQGALGEIPFGEAYPEIWLPDAVDLAAARKIIAAYERPVDSAGDVPCPVCGEDNPFDFGICWHCGGRL